MSSSRARDVTGLSLPEAVRAPAFEVHLDILIDVSVRLVNSLTGDWAGGEPQVLPDGAARTKAVAEALAGEDRQVTDVDAEQADALTGTAGRLRRAFDLVTRGDLESAVGVLNDLMDEAGAQPALVPRASGGWAMHFRGKDDGLAVGWTAGCATGLALALGSNLGGRLGVCQATRCDQVFVDYSRNRVRRFCSTSCQNRMKSAAFRHRRKPAAPVGRPSPVRTPEDGE
jgi:predicted RNA-binding Zn ribbon-like protein